MERLGYVLRAFFMQKMHGILHIFPLFRAYSPLKRGDGGMKKAGAVLAIGLFSFFAFLVLGYEHTLKGYEEQAAEAPLVYEPAESALKGNTTVDADTEMIYQYFYTNDRVTKEQKEQAPLFLQGLDREALASVYNGWQMVLFSPEKVILRCQIEGKSSESYILGEDDGYLAVFYEDGQKALHLQERTDIPLTALPEGEALQIREGLRVTGEENLAKLLADFMS